MRLDLPSMRPVFALSSAGMLFACSLMTATVRAADQATGAYVMRAWAKENGRTLERYLAGYVESLRWAMQPANRADSLALLMERVKLPPEVAKQAYDLMREPKFGLATDARFYLDGFKNLLAIRAEMEGQWGGKPPGPGKYYDLQYYERAVKTLAR